MKKEDYSKVTVNIYTYYNAKCWCIFLLNFHVLKMWSFVSVFFFKDAALPSLSWTCSSSHNWINNIINNFKTKSLVKDQCGFRANQSTEEALVRVANNFRCRVAGKTLSVLILLDLQCLGKSIHPLWWFHLIFYWLCVYIYLFYGFIQLKYWEK